MRCAEVGRVMGPWVRAGRGSQSRVAQRSRERDSTRLGSAQSLGPRLHPFTFKFRVTFKPGQLLLCACFA